ncbi:esterase-like activity of phytase family protein [Erythrobacter alti]|uniref:esterase-like activity of phytase family protein n=1 Tax=Erythrobacter alti TaxID=1896145 RepID=UPI0030F3A9A1
MAVPSTYLKTRKRRLIAAILLAVALAPGTLVRTDIPDRHVLSLGMAELTELPESERYGGFTREGVWELASPNLDFGGYSALLVLDNGERLRAFSDRGTSLTFARPESPGEFESSFAHVWNRGRLSRTVPDIEAATRDAATGDYWLAFESDHAVIRYSRASELEALREPPEWRDWRVNAGAEAMARLPDGRFIVLPEDGLTGLLYPGDPTRDAEPIRFHVALPGGLVPTDMAALPDGRVMVLMRRVSWGWPPFTAALGIADPNGLQDGDLLEVAQLLDLDRLLPPENYEGLAVQQQANGSHVLWIIADDNLASFQRTLLAKLVWDGHLPQAQEKAREGIPRAPRIP